MKAYRFTTKVSAQGTIQIPYSSSLFDEEVEVVILPKSKPQEGKIKPMEFVEKWKGFLADHDTDQLRHEYLSEKYK